MVHLRPYSGRADLAAMKDLVRELWRAPGADGGPHVECHPADLDWRMNVYAEDRPGWPAITLAFEADHLRGFAWCIKDSLVDLVVRRAADEVAAALVAAVIGSGPSPTLYALASNTTLARALAAHGFVPAGDDYLHFARTLAPGHRPEGAWPVGYRPVGMDVLGDVAARAAVHRATFGSERMTPERYLGVTQAELYRPELDLVAVDAAGVPVSFVLAWLDPALGVGLCEPVGTHPDHRGRGLARALIGEALVRLAAAGATQAIIGALADDTITPGLYASLGFVAVDRNLGHRDARRAAG